MGVVVAGAAWESLLDEVAGGSATGLLWCSRPDCSEGKSMGRVGMLVGSGFGRGVIAEATGSAGVSPAGFGVPPNPIHHPRRVA